MYCCDKKRINYKTNQKKLLCNSDISKTKLALNASLNL